MIKNLGFTLIPVEVLYIMLSSIFQMPLATQTYGSQMLQSGKGKDWFIARIFQLLSWDMGAIFELQQLKY